jgi:ketosteroid isomerase-like protein
MSTFSRQELEDTFTAFRATLAKAMRTKDWNAWSEFFTEDALYIEHAMGTFNGRAEILDWVVRTMASPLIDNIESFPVGWHMIDEERGWVIAQFISRMREIGDGKVHETYCFTLLKYAGNGQWNYEEDIYNPLLMQEMLEAWEAARVKFGK